MVVTYEDTGRPCPHCNSGTFVLYGGEAVPKCRYCGVLETNDGPKRSISPSTAKKVTNG